MALKGFIFDMKRFAVHDGPGIRTTVYLKGCPLQCQWCHNPESQRLRPLRLPARAGRKCANLAVTDDPNVIGKAVSSDAVIAGIEKDLAFYDESGGGVTFSGGEPTMQPAFLKALLEGCREREIHTAVDTSGFAPWRNFEMILPLTDLFLYDLKLMDDMTHRQYVNVSNIRIHENLRRLHDKGAAVNIRVPLIPGITDTRANLAGIIDCLKELPGIRQLDLLPYNPIGESKYKRFQIENQLGHLHMQTAERLEHIRRQFDPLNIDVTIGG